MLFKLSQLNSNLVLTLGYLNPALNNSALCAMFVVCYFSDLCDMFCVCYINNLCALFCVCNINDLYALVC